MKNTFTLFLRVNQNLIRFILAKNAKSKISSNTQANSWELSKNSEVKYFFHGLYLNIHAKTHSFIGGTFQRWLDLRYVNMD